MPHGPMDIYAQFRFLDVRIFGPAFTAFRQKYAVMGGFQRKQITGFQNLEELEAYDEQDHVPGRKGSARPAAGDGRDVLSAL